MHLARIVVLAYGVALASGLRGESIKLTDVEREEMLTSLNSFRGDSDSGNMECLTGWDNELEKKAESSAAKCDDSVNGGTENGAAVVYVSGSTASTSDFIKQLDEMKKSYKYDNDSCDSNSTDSVCKNYKQFAWWEGGKIGCSKAICRAPPSISTVLLLCYFEKNLPEVDKRRSRMQMSQISHDKHGRRMKIQNKVLRECDAATLLAALYQYHKQMYIISFMQWERLSSNANQESSVFGKYDKEATEDVHLAGSGRPYAKADACSFCQNGYECVSKLCCAQSGPSTGSSCGSKPKGLVALHRVAHKYRKDTVLTTSTLRKTQLLASDYEDKGIFGYISTDQQTSCSRLTPLIEMKALGREDYVYITGDEFVAYYSQKHYNFVSSVGYVVETPGFCSANVTAYQFFRLSIYHYYTPSKEEAQVLLTRAGINSQYWFVDKPFALWDSPD